MPRLRSFYIGYNPLTEPPTEVLGDAIKEFTRADVEVIRQYFRQLQEANWVYLYEAKLLIIGEGGAGKTTLARKILDPITPLPAKGESTEGLEILRWHFDLQGDHATQSETGKYTVNIWDFGGQEIYFATHQFFLTKRAVYLLVADTRQQHTDFYDWLRMQETFGGESPVLLLKNRNREKGNVFTIENLPQLQERFANLQPSILEVDFREVPDGEGWHELLHQIENHLLRLPHIGQPSPATWVHVRQAIRNDERSVISWQAFVEICREQQMTREEDIRQLGDYLHNLGDILYFHEDPVLCDHVILKPTWGLDAVYKVLDEVTIADQLGKFTLADLRQLWSAVTYAGHHLTLLRLMENFQLCYPLPDERDTYIAPQLLSPAVPEYGWERHDNLQLRYVYPIFMPRGILSRMIVKLHQRIEEQRLVWRAGVILHDGYARAEVLELRGENQIRIRVSGRNKRDLLMEIVRALDDLHRGFPKLRFMRQIPCNCEACIQSSAPHYYDLGKLRERLANRKETIECQNPPYHDVQIRSIVDEVDPWFGDARRRGDTHYHYHSDGGTIIGGNAEIGGDFMGRDRYGGEPYS